MHSTGAGFREDSRAVEKFEAKSTLRREIRVKWDCPFAAVRDGLTVIMLMNIELRDGRCIGFNCENAA